ncbi:Uncharacterised protein [Vibrio cholerae]|nr:Uncharacterised protein [Vibrio cholerae]
MQIASLRFHLPLPPSHGSEVLYPICAVIHGLSNLAQLQPQIPPLSPHPLQVDCYLLQNGHSPTLVGKASYLSLIHAGSFHYPLLKPALVGQRQSHPP